MNAIPSMTDRETKHAWGRIGALVGGAAALVTLYFTTHHAWPLAWVLWAGIGALVRLLTTAASLSLEPERPRRSSQAPLTSSIPWPRLPPLVLLALFVLALFNLHTGFQISASAAVLASPAWALAAFSLGFFHRLVVGCLRTSAKQARSIARRPPGSM
jgi:hypothetical protein